LRPLIPLLLPEHTQVELKIIKLATAAEEERQLIRQALMAAGVNRPQPMLEATQPVTEVLIPPAVLAELMPETRFPEAGNIQQAREAGWLQAAELKDTRFERALRLELDGGEAAAIALALEVCFQQILMDERDGRIRAKTPPGGAGLVGVGCLAMELLGEILQTYPFLFTQTFPGSGHPGQKPGIILQPVIKPVILARKANQNAGRLPVAGDNYFLSLCQSQVFRKAVLNI
jgi:hypothetical protein